MYEFDKELLSKALQEGTTEEALVSELKNTIAALQKNEMGDMIKAKQEFIFTKNVIIDEFCLTPNEIKAYYEALTKCSERWKAEKLRERIEKLSIMSKVVEKSRLKRDI